MTPEQIAEAVAWAKKQIAPTEAQSALLAEHERANKTEADCLRYMDIANEYARDAARWRAVRETLEVVTYEYDGAVGWWLTKKKSGGRWNPKNPTPPATVDEAADRLVAEQEAQNDLRSP